MNRDKSIMHPSNEFFSSPQIEHRISTIQILNPLDTTNSLTYENTEDIHRHTHIHTHTQHFLYIIVI